MWLELHAARIGLVGQPSPWLVASAPPPEAVRASWGPLLVDVPMEEFEGPLRADKFDPELVEQVCARRGGGGGEEFPYQGIGAPGGTQRAICSRTTGAGWLWAAGAAPWGGGPCKEGNQASNKQT